MKIKVLGDARFRLASHVVAQSRTPIYSHTVASCSSLQRTYEGNPAAKSILLPPQHTPLHGPLTRGPGEELPLPGWLPRTLLDSVLPGVLPWFSTLSPLWPAHSPFLLSALSTTPAPTFPLQPVDNPKQENQAEPPLSSSCPKVAHRRQSQGRRPCFFWERVRRHSSPKMPPHPPPLRAKCFPHPPLPFPELWGPERIVGKRGVAGAAEVCNTGVPPARPRLCKLRNLWPFWGLWCRMHLQPPNPLCASRTDLCGADARVGRRTQCPSLLGGSGRRSGEEIRQRS